MNTPDKWLYEYAVVRLVPRIDREEFVNIGLIMMCKRQKWLRGMIWLDENRIKALYPAIDCKIISNQAKLFERTDLPDKDLPVEEKYRWLSAVKSAMLQTSPSHPGIVPVRNEFQESDSIRILNQEFERLFNQLVIC